MRRPAWKGRSPEDDEEARALLVAAAARCIAREGLDKTSVASIAREAGVTRQTVYRYFESGAAIVAEAEIRAGGGILRGLHELARRYDTPSERLIEAMVYLYREMPRDPLLGPYFSGRAADRIDGPHFTEVALAVASANLEEVFGITKASKTQKRRLDELAELAVRLLASFLEHPGQTRRTDREFRAFLYQWLAPSIERAFAT